MGEPVGGADAFRHVEGDPLRVALGDESLEVDAVLEDLVETAGHEPPIRKTDRGPFDSGGAPVGEDEVTDAPDVALAEVPEQRIVETLFRQGDPHVDPVLAHRLRENEIELVRPNGAEPLPAAAGLLSLAARSAGAEGHCG